MFNVGSYACLEIHLHFQRDLSIHINELFVPSSFIVCLSFLSFFIDYKSAAARAPLGAMSVLTVVNLLSGKINFKNETISTPNLSAMNLLVAMDKKSYLFLNTL
jgi:hypothetical protein